MKLVKTNEQVNKVYNEEGNVTENVTSINYNIIDANNNSIGNVNIWQGGYSLSVNKSGTVEELRDEVEAMFNKEIEK